jgi:hypothetical protein
MQERWVDNIESNIKRTKYESVDWIHLAEDSFSWRAVVNKGMNLRILRSKNYDWCSFCTIVKLRHSAIMYEV